MFLEKIKIFSKIYNLLSRKNLLENEPTYDLKLTKNPIYCQSRIVLDGYKDKNNHKSKINQTEKTLYKSIYVVNENEADIHQGIVKLNDLEFEFEGKYIMDNNTGEKIAISGIAEILYKNQNSGKWILEVVNIPNTIKIEEIAQEYRSKKYGF